MGDDGVFPGGDRGFISFPPRIALIAAVIAIGVELFRLVHFPWLNAFRLTLPGALLLGAHFFGVEYSRVWRRDWSGSDP